MFIPIIKMTTKMTDTTIDQVYLEAIANTGQIKGAEVLINCFFTSQKLNRKKTVGDWSSRPGPAILMADISKFTLKGIFVYSHESELPAVACSLWQLRQVSLLHPARPRIRLD